jgi:hypothetical protein
MDRRQYRGLPVALVQFPEGAAMTCDWSTLLLAAAGGWAVVNVALLSIVVLMAYWTNPTLRR